jgi:glutamyl-tRNA synthetase
MNKYEELASLIFPDIKDTIEDLEKRYPKRDLPEGAMVTRFAPSPTGFLHTGSLFTSLISYKMAKQSNGVFFVRLEDTDQKREISGSGVELIRQLEKFGIVPDEGFTETDVDKGNYGPYTQSKRASIYNTVIKYMIEKGLAYPCFCSSEELDILRKKQEELKVRPGYYGEYATCRNLTPEEAIVKIKNNEPYVIRFKSHGVHENKIVVTDLIRGTLELSENDLDIVIQKSDGLPTYHFAHLVDDHFMRTTHITRGEEWLPSLPIHIELFKAMNWEPLKYAHLPVIMKLENSNKRKLSKRKDPEAAVSYFLDLGYPIDGILEYLLTIANSNYEEWRQSNLSADKYDFMLTFEKMSLDGALFDIDKVKNISKEYLSRLPAKVIASQVYDWSKVYDLELKSMIESNYDYFVSIMNIEREKPNPRKDYEKYSDVKDAISYFFEDNFDKVLQEPLPFNPSIAKEDIVNILTAYKDIHNTDCLEEEWFASLKAIAPLYGFAANIKEYKKNPTAFKGHIGDVSEIVRISVTGRKQTPNLFFILQILTKEVVLNRIDKVLKTLI